MLPGGSHSPSRTLKRQHTQQFWAEKKSILIPPSRPIHQEPPRMRGHPAEKRTTLTLFVVCADVESRTADAGGASVAPTVSSLCVPKVASGSLQNLFFVLSDLRQILPRE